MGTKSESERLDLTLPAEVLRLGHLLSSCRQNSRPNFRTAKTAEDEYGVARLTAHLAEKVRRSASPQTRKAFGLLQATSSTDVPTRVRIIAFLGWQLLADTTAYVPVATIVNAVGDQVADPKAILRTRHLVGQMCVEGSLALFGECELWHYRVVLPIATLAWLSGGGRSLGLMNHGRLAALQEGKPSAVEADARSEFTHEIPSAVELHRRIRETVIGVDDQIRVLASHLVLNAFRAQLLRSGQDLGTPNHAIYLLGSPGTGKTTLATTAARLCGMPSAVVDSSDITAEGYVGYSVTDAFKPLVAAANGRIEDARFGMMVFDEWSAKGGKGASDATTSCVQQEMLRVMSGQQFVVGGRRGGGYERTFTFDSTGTFFVFAGFCEGLDKLIERRRGRQAIGFSGSGSPKELGVLRDALHDYGFIRPFINRLTAIIWMPDPTLDMLMRVATAPSGTIAATNRLLAARGLKIGLTPDAVRKLAEYGLETGSFYRGMQMIVSTLIEDAVYCCDHGAVEYDDMAVRQAIARTSNVQAASAAGDGSDPDEFDLHPEMIGDHGQT